MDSQYNEEKYQIYEIRRKGFLYDQGRLIVEVLKESDAKEQYESLKRDCPDNEYWVFRTRTERIL